MRSLTIVFLVFLLMFCLSSDKISAGVDAGLSINDGEIKGFYLAIGEHFKVSESQVTVVKQLRIQDEEIPVAFYIARKANVNPDTVIRFRMGRKSWMDIAVHFGLTAEIFYVSLKHNPGPPYGKAHGYYKKMKKSDWSTIRLADIDIINFVNLKFISEHYGYSPDEVVKMRGNGKSFIKINSDVKKYKAKQKAKQLTDNIEEQKEKKNKGKGKKK